MQFSKANLRQPSKVTQCPMAAAASITDDHNITDGVITEADYAAINKNTLIAIQQLLQLDAELKAQVREWGEDLPD